MTNPKQPPGNLDHSANYQRIADALSESERRLHTLMNNLPGMAFRCQYNANWAMLFVSMGAHKLTGYSAIELTAGDGATFASLILPDDNERVFQEVSDQLARQNSYQVIYRIRRANGDTRWVWEQGQLVNPTKPRDQQLLEGFITDVTEQQEAQRIHQAVSEISNTVVAQVGDNFQVELLKQICRMLDADCAFISPVQSASTDGLRTAAVVVNGEAADNFDYSLAGTPCEKIIEDGECTELNTAHLAIPGKTRAAEQKYASSYIGRRLDDASGQCIGVFLVLYEKPIADLQFAKAVVRILGGRAAVELARIQSDKYIRQLAYHDSVTGLPNRSYFLEQLELRLNQAERTGGSLGLIIFDLRRFKETNDLYGHAVGDKLLHAVGQRLQKKRRPSELLARLSGDEFAVLFPDVSRCKPVIQRFWDAIQDQVAIDGIEFYLNARLGLAEYPKDALTAGVFLQHATTALHHAKSTGQEKCVFDERIANRLQRQQTMKNRFWRALERNQLELHYQPQFDLQTHQLIGAEALCRWHDSEWGWVSPAEFIPMAEQQGLMTILGEWLFASVSQQLVRWRTQGASDLVRVSVNVSAQQFDDDNLPERIRELTKGIEPGCMTIELTESALMHNPQQSVALTKALCAAGFGLAIDDFGTGYSSLAYLKRYTADTLKIDISFIRDMLTDTQDHAIVHAIISMAKVLGMRTIAEGVETEQQAKALSALGCDAAQGYYFGRPVTADVFARQWLNG